MDGGGKVFIDWGVEDRGKGVERSHSAKLKVKVERYRRLGMFGPGIDMTIEECDALYFEIRNVIAGYKHDKVVCMMSNFKL